jgi:shikimate kinase
VKKLLKEALKGINIYLIGMMGAGKTTIGKQLATALSYRFFDTDRLIEQLTQRTISQLFAESGEANFRALESQILAELSAYKKLAIATGGGVILKQENWSYLRHGVIVWLDVPIEQLQTRLVGNKTRPLLQEGDLEAKLRSLLQQRQALYAQADVRIVPSANDTAQQTCDRVIQGIWQTLKNQSDLN